MCALVKRLLRESKMPPLSPQTCAMVVQKRQSPCQASTVINGTSIGNCKAVMSLHMESISKSPIAAKENWPKLQFTFMSIFQVDSSSNTPTVFLAVSSHGDSSKPSVPVFKQEYPLLHMLTAEPPGDGVTQSPFISMRDFSTLTSQGLCIFYRHEEVA